MHAKLQQAVALHQQGQLAKAETIYLEILRAQPRHFDALHLLGVVALQKREPQRAVDLIEKAIAIFPRNVDFHSNYGNALLQLDQAAAAVQSYDKALAIEPNNAQVHFNRGIGLKKLGRLEAALQSYDAAIATKPGFAEAYANRGSILRALNRYEEALQSFDKAIAIRPNYFDAYSGRGIVLHELDRPEEALQNYERAIALKPDYAEAHYNRGKTLQKLKQLEAAADSYEKATTIKPNYLEAHSNQGNALLGLNQVDAALECYDKAIALAPNHAEVLAKKSLALLLKGELEAGWKLYESRWKCDSFPSKERGFAQPLWLGDEALQEKAILLHAEQGLGDVIQFCRYASLVAARGARVILEVPGSLASLLADVDGVSQVVEKGKELPRFDFHCPLMSLPLAFKTGLGDIPSSTEYLAASASNIARWRRKLDISTKPLVGLVWSGSSSHQNDGLRSIPLSELLRHLPRDFRYVSLQKELRDADRAALQSLPDILHFGDELGDFSDTAALCALMDLVISVDTSVAHLNGALGGETWILLAYAPDWRWMLERTDSPWYPSVKLYRQDIREDWSSVLARVASDLRQR